MFEGVLQPMHLLLILVIALVVFGPKNLPGIGKGLGEASCIRLQRPPGVSYFELRQAAPIPFAATTNRHRPAPTS